MVYFYYETKVKKEHFITINSQDKKYSLEEII